MSILILFLTIFPSVSMSTPSYKKMLTYTLLGSLIGGTTGATIGGGSRFLISCMLEQKSVQASAQAPFIILLSATTDAIKGFTVGLGISAFVGGIAGLLYAIKEHSKSEGHYNYLKHHKALI